MCNDICTIPFPSHICAMSSSSSSKNKMRLISFPEGREPYSILIDSGATNSFISKKLVQKHSLSLCPLPVPIPLFIFENSHEPSQVITDSISWSFELPSFPSFVWNLMVVDAPSMEDIILGYDFRSTGTQFSTGERD